MKWIPATFLAVVFLPVIVVVAALVFLDTADLTQHREFIAEQISRIAGRRLSLNGDVELNISSTPSIVITDVVLANAPWAAKPEMLTIDRIEAGIDLLPLLHGDIHILSFHLLGVRLLLETSSNGSGNWVLVDSADHADVDASGASAEMKLPWISDLIINDAELTYRDGQTGKEDIAKIDHAMLGAADLLSPTIIDIAGQVNSNPVAINGKLALPSVLVTDNVDIPIELHVNALGLTADATGNFKGATQASAIELNLHASAANLDQLKQLFGAVVPVVRPVEMDVEIKGDQGQPVLFKLSARAGKARLSTMLTFLRDTPKPNMIGEVKIQDVDVVSMWAPLISGKSARSSQAETRVSVQTPAQRYDQPIPLAWLNAFDANVMLSLKRINLPQADIKSLQGRFIVEKRTLRTEGLKLATDAGSLAADLHLDARGKQPVLELDLDTTPVALSMLAQLAEYQRFAQGRADAAISIAATGDTVARLVESVHGTVQLGYNDQKRNEKVSIKLVRQPRNTTTGNPGLTVIADGDIDGKVVELSGSIIPPADLLVSGKPYQIDLTLQALDVSARVFGKIADPYALNGLDLDVEAHATDMNGLRRAFGERVPALGKVDLATGLTYGQGQMQLSKLAIELLDARIDGVLLLDISTDMPELQGELTFTDMDIDKLLQTQQKPAGPVAAAQPANGRLFSDEPLPFDSLPRAKINLTLRARNLIHNKKSLGDVGIRMKLDKEKLSASLLKHSAIHGEIDSDFVIDTSGKEAPVVTGKLKAHHLELGELMLAGGGSAAIEGALAIDLALHGQGESLAQIMGTLDGDIHLLMEKGSANAEALDLYFGGLTALVGTIFVDRSSKTRINCAISDVELNDGIINTRVVVLDTQYSTVFFNGQVDLNKEQLDITVTPQAKGVTLSVGYPVRLHGRLNKPDVAIEKTGALIKTGELWANIVYPPSLLVNFSDLTGGRENPCISMVAEKAGIPILRNITKAVGDVVTGVGDVVRGSVKDVGSGIDNIFEKEKHEDDSKASDEIDVDDDDFGMDF